MTVNTTLEIVDSYIGLLIMQYLNKPNATGFIQTLVSPAIIPQVSTQSIAFSSVPTSGNFVLSYNGNSTSSIAWNASTSTIQSDLQSLTGLSSATLSGSIAANNLIVTFSGVAAPAYSLLVASNTLFASSSSVSITILETDQTLPLAVQNAFNLVTGTTIATGVQLDILGKYVGVTRSGYGFSGTNYITLDDADFLSLIQMAIIQNNSGSSLATIDQFLFTFFPEEIYVTDHANMTMTYVISATIGSQNLVELFITEGLLPAPMAVQVQVAYVPTANLFSFRTYELPNTVGSPFNDYADYQTDWPWLSYQNIV